MTLPAAYAALRLRALTLAPDDCLLCDRVDVCLSSYGQPSTQVAEAIFGNPCGIVLTMSAVVEWRDGLASALTQATGKRLEGWRVVDGHTLIVLR